MNAERELDNELGKMMQTIARKMARDLRQQVPQRSLGNPYATGDLIRQLSSRDAIEARKDANGNWTIFIDYPFYGNYTAFGTKDEAPRWRAQMQTNIFDRDPFVGYRPGKGGIKPQNWLSLRARKQEYEDLLADEFGESMEVFINRLTEIGIRTR